MIKTKPNARPWPKAAAEQVTCLVRSIPNLVHQLFQHASAVASRVRFGISPAGAPAGSIILFPCHANALCCGLAGIISIKGKPAPPDAVDLNQMERQVEKIENKGFKTCQDSALSLEGHYLGGSSTIKDLLSSVRTLKQDEAFARIFSDQKIQDRLSDFSSRLLKVANRETAFFTEQMGSLEAKHVDILSNRIEDLKDISWCINVEITRNIKKVAAFVSGINIEGTPAPVIIFKKINAVLNSIDRLEVRGRDSAGISLLFILDPIHFQTFIGDIENHHLEKELEKRTSGNVLVNRNLSIRRSNPDEPSETVAITFTYKIAAEIGSLGDNIRFLRSQITEDRILKRLVLIPHQFQTVSSHTRWASVGAITEPNCHPVDNAVNEDVPCNNGIIHACLNGDIDNYLKIKKQIEENGVIIPEQISTDTKIIPLQIEKYVKKGHEILEAFRLAVCDFEGSHAIAMHTDLAPGKFFLAQKGSGQAVFVGVSKDHYMPASEVYGFIEETPCYLKMDGEKITEGKSGPTQGQIFVLDQDSKGGLDGIFACYYDGTVIDLNKNDLKTTAITSRDIDRQDYPHYFLKEVSEAPASVEKTLQNRWKRKENGEPVQVVHLDANAFPASIETAFENNTIKRVFFVGQGTAGVAALACADILTYYVNDPNIMITALKASELSGFRLNETDSNTSMADALVVAISQSGTTTDTNRTVDMVRARGAHTVAIVNRRDSDITFKVDGVVYTSSGRDIEMSVASTKAFYSQIVAGAILGLKIAWLTGRRSEAFVSSEIGDLLQVPGCMRKVLAIKDKIAASAQKLAAQKTYWAAVGSGPNKASADEIRIKLSELCYKTISSDYVEDKKHIDLSSEPLIIVCAAGSKGTVIGDIIKDTAIFKAHKAAPVVIADEGEDRFAPYAEDVFHTPPVSEHLAPILNTLVGHIWGYYAALAINEGSRFLHDFRQEVKQDIDQYAEKGLDVYEIVLEKSFREKMTAFYTLFRQKRKGRKLPASISNASDLTLLFKYLSGRLPVSDFELDFDIKGTALNMINTFFKFIGDSINQMSRPIDAIKHQAKTVTVGTSRISEKVEGILFEMLANSNLKPSQLLNRNVIVMKNLQPIISGIKGSVLYEIGGLNLLGEPTEKTVIKMMKKTGVLENIPSRVETDSTLKGTKRIIAKEGNVYIGKGRKDGRSIVVIPAIEATPEGPGRIKHMLLLNIEFKDTVPLENRIKALGGKYERIKNIVQENSIPWEDAHLNQVAIDELFGKSAEKIGEFIAGNMA